MKIKISKLGAIQQAEFELGAFTIICGGNNTGKTYATYALFGFLYYWREAFSINVPEDNIRQLLNDGTTELNIHDFIINAESILKEGCKAYTKQLPTIFASSEKHFADSVFSVNIDHNDIKPASTYDLSMGSANAQLFSIIKKSNQPNLCISLLVEKEKVNIPLEVINRIIGDALKDIVFGSLFQNPFIASAERTGAAIFRVDLNFPRNRMLEHMSSMGKDINPFDFLTKVYSDYALPVKTNVEFTRRLEDIAKKESFVAKEYPNLMEEFTNIIGGDYMVTKNDELFFIPKGKRIKLTMDESSSAVRSLLDIGFYLRHVAKPGDLLMVDEPELNLHPENQRRIARLFARLVNIGINVFITTHSDYIIKELNTLIMLKQDKPHLKQIAERAGYKPEDLISAEKLRVYIAEEALIKLDGKTKKSRCQTLVSADIDPELGIEARSFDKTIDEMNRIQEEIIWGGDE